jgi:hypothetical protein
MAASEVIPLRDTHLVQMWPTDFSFLPSPVFSVLTRVAHATTDFDWVISAYCPDSRQKEKRSTLSVAPLH